MALAGNLVQINDLAFYALIVWVFGLVLVGFGARRGLVFWPSVLHLVFMLPLPQFLYWQVSTTLQLVSSEVGVALVRGAGVPVFLEGNVIDLGVYKLQVAEACSGLRYLFPIMSFTYVFAVLYRGPVWHKLVLLFSAVPLAVLMNAVRIGVIGLLVDRHGIGAAEGFLHVFEGWVIFLFCIATLFLMAKAMQRLSGDRRPLGAALDLDFSGLGARARADPRRRGLAGAGRRRADDRGAVARLEPRPRADRGGAGARRLRAVPARDRGRLGRRLGRPQRQPRAGDRGGARRRRLSGGGLRPGAGGAAGRPLPLLVRRPDRRRRDPLAGGLPARRRLGGGGDRAATVALPGTATGRLRLNRAVIRKGLETQLVYYWFAGRGRTLTNDFAAKFAAMADSLTRGRTDGGLVRLITPIGAGGEAAADARLAGFLAAIADRLPRYLPD